MADPQTITKEVVLAAYNLENGSDLTFVQLGQQLAFRELQRFRRKMLEKAIVEEVVV